MVARAPVVLTARPANSGERLRDQLRQLARPPSVQFVDMAHLHLPTQHDETDLAIAGALAEALRSADLYVTWSRAAGAARPAVGAEVACGARRRRGVLGGLRAALSRRRGR